MDTIADGTAAITEAVIGGLFSRLRDQAAHLLVTVERRALSIQDRMVKRLFASVIVLVAVLFLITAGLLALIEYLNMAPAVAFLLGGVLLILVWLYLRYRDARDEYIEDLR